MQKKRDCITNSCDLNENVFHNFLEEMKMFSSFLLFARKKYEVVEFLSKNQEENG
jgi:hypothetical protein